MPVIMTDRDFCYWLRGYFELAEFARKADASGYTPALSLTSEQLMCVRQHLDLVFNQPELPAYERDESSIAHVVSRRC
jgi:hypothetical protein